MTAKYVEQCTLLSLVNMGWTRDTPILSGMLTTDRKPSISGALSYHNRRILYSEVRLECHAISGSQTLHRCSIDVPERFTPERNPDTGVLLNNLYQHTLY